jgi:phosphoribosylanthranilate isomerase
MRTRIKICGLTREADVATACAAGADAVGFVCYPSSPRHVAPHRLRALARELGPFTVPVLLFVNAAPDFVRAARFTATNRSPSARTTVRHTCAPFAWRRGSIC